MNELINFIINDASAKIKNQFLEKDLKDFSNILIYEDETLLKTRSIGFYGWTKTNIYCTCYIYYLNQDPSVLDQFIANKLQLYKEVAQKIQEKVRNSNEKIRTTND